MLSKCANPGCSAPFRYLNEGTVYVAEWCQDGDVCVLTEAAAGPGKRWSRLEMFWLCGPCNKAVTLTVTGNEVVAVPRAKLLAQGQRALRELRISG